MKYLIIMLVIVIIILSITCVIQRENNVSLKYINESLEGQIKSMQNAAEEMKARFDVAKKQADANAKKWQDKANSVMKADVPKDCDKAIQWAIDQARKNGL